MIFSYRVVKSVIKHSRLSLVPSTFCCVPPDQGWFLCIFPDFSVWEASSKRTFTSGTNHPEVPELMWSGKKSTKNSEIYVCTGKTEPKANILQYFFISLAVIPSPPDPLDYLLSAVLVSNFQFPFFAHFCCGDQFLEDDRASASKANSGNTVWKASENTSEKWGDEPPEGWNWWQRNFSKQVFSLWQMNSALKTNARFLRSIPISRREEAEFSACDWLISSRGMKWRETVWPGWGSRWVP